MLVCRAERIQYLDPEQTSGDPDQMLLNMVLYCLPALCYPSSGSQMDLVKKYRQSW